MKKYFDAVKGFVKDNAFKMLKGGEGVFRHPFIDPGAGYEYNLWDWDSYWSAKALFEYCEYFKGEKGFDYAINRERVINHAKGNILNFFDLQQDDGFIAMVTTANGLFASYLKDEHLAGKKVNQHKPFLCKGVLNASKYSGDFSWFNVNCLRKYLEFYDKNQFDAKTGLYFWRNDVMIGIDNNPTVFALPDDSCADIYLNCFIYTELCAMAELLQIRGEDSIYYQNKAEALKRSIREYLYDAYDEMYYSAFLQVETHKNEIFHHGIGAFWKCLPLKIRFWACFLPIACGITTVEEGRKILEKNYIGDNFISEYGIRTVAKSERMYNIECSSNPSNWLGPVWTISNYCTWVSLKRAGMEAQAREMVEKTVRLLGKDVIENNNMSESYIPETGEPMLNKGFLNWNILVLEMIKDYESTES